MSKVNNHQYADISDIIAKTIHGNIYCYCIVKKTNAVISSYTGLDSRYNLSFITHKDISMVVSVVSSDEFSEVKLCDAVNDIKWLSQYAIEHEKIVETVKGQLSPVLPMKFCTIYKEEASIKLLLEKHYSAFLESLNYFNDKEEYGVKVYVEKNTFMKNMKSKMDYESKNENNDNSGRNYLLRKKLEKENREAFITDVSHKIDTMVSFISEWSTESVSNRIIETENKDMLMHNASYLIENIYIDKFFKLIKWLNDSYAKEGFELEISGPWPCYSFSPKIE